MVQDPSCAESSYLPTKRCGTVICILNWQHEYATIAAARQIQEGHDVFIFENEVDETPEMEGVRVFSSKENLGNSIARNRMIGEALKEGYRYIGLLDGDIVPPLGMFTMFRLFLNQNESVHTVYRHRMGHLDLKDLGKEQRCSYAMEMPFGHVFPSQCSLNRREVFETMLFPESEPFDGPGWGGEDDLLGLMLRDELQGYHCVHAQGTPYAHDYNHSVTKGSVDRDFFNRSMRRLLYSRCFTLCSKEQRSLWWHEGVKPKMIVRADMMELFNTWTPELVPSPGEPLKLADSDMTRERFFVFLGMINYAMLSSAIKVNPFL